MKNNLMNNKFAIRKQEVTKEDSNEENKKEIKLKSEMYNRDNEKMIRREEDNSNAIMWGFVLGFILFFILLICIIIFTK